MMKKIVFVLCLCCLTLAGYAQNDNFNADAKSKEDIWTNSFRKDQYSNIDVPSQILLSPRGDTPGSATIKLKVEGHIAPSINNSFTLGTSEMRWKDLFVGPHSLKVGQGNGDQTIISYSNTSGISRTEFDVDDDNDIDVSLTELGDLEFVGTLKPDNDAGDNGEILRSNGATTSPTWVDIQTLAWSKTGNSGTDASTNFVGTTDNNDLVFRTNNVKRARFLAGGDSAGSFMPETDNIYSLGTPGHRWKDLYMGPSTIRMGGFISGSKDGQQEQTLDEVSLSYVDGMLVCDKGLQSNGNVNPNNNDAYGLGTDTNRWADLYLAGNSLHIGTSATEATMSYDDALMLLQFNTDGTGAPEVIMGGSGGAGKLGIGATPNTSLDVNGDAAFRFSGLTLANGANTAVDVGASSALRITGPTAAFEIHGITGGQNGKVVELYNASGQTMRIFNESSSESTPVNRIVTGTGNSFEVRNMSGVALAYSPTDGRWLLTNATRNTSNLVYTMKTYSIFGSSQAGWAPDFGYIAHRVASTSNISIFGIGTVGAQDGTVIQLLNVGSSNIILQNESGSAANTAYRIITGTGNNETLAPNKPATLIYDGTSQRWRIISGR